MAGTLQRLAMHYVLVLVLLAQCRPAFPAPTPASCALNKTLELGGLIREQVQKLLRKYIEYHGPRSGSVPDDVPDSTVHGTTVSEKLQDIRTKDVLFSLHISQVEAYQKDLLPNPKPIQEALKPVKHRLPHLLGRVTNVLRYIDPSFSELTTPAPLQLSHDDDFTKIVYGWGVIVRLEDWLTEVLQVLQEAEGLCD